MNRSRVDKNFSFLLGMEFGGEAREEMLFKLFQTRGFSFAETKAVNASGIVLDGSGEKGNSVVIWFQKGLKD